MKNTLVISSILVVGLAVAGCNRNKTASTTASDTSPSYSSTDTTFSQGVADAGQSVASASRDAATAVTQASDNISAQLGAARITAAEIEADLAAGRAIVRTSNAAGAPTGSMDRSTLKNAVKSRLQADSQTSMLKLDVNADKDGAIELEGKAQSADQIARAISLALDTTGVTKVTSKVKIAKDANL